MTHETERVGSPQTLVCTKTRRTYRRQCEQHTADRAAMRALLELAGSGPVPATVAALVHRLNLAKERAPQPLG